ncbi:ABC transporter substrate-binding protein [Paraburkholderia sp. EG285A]|uniref:ABC transporter substrate-binding protein n=1 Tax=Paraburkholderia sp. EG285A TaxID=3237009 RepID=UPI0034D38D5E
MWIGKRVVSALVVSLGALIVWEAPPSDAIAADKTTIRLAFSKDYAPNTPDLQMGWMEGIKKNFEKENPNVEVELVPIQAGYDDLVTKLSLMLSSKGRAPDVAQIPAQQTAQWATNGLLLPLDDKVATSGWWPRMATPVKGEGTVDGKVYAASEGVNTSALYYDIDNFKKAGIPTPWKPRNWDDVIAAAEKIKANVPNVSPLLIATGTAGGSQGLMLGALNLVAASSDPTIYDESTGKWVVDSKGLRETLGFYQRAAKEGLFAPASQMMNANMTGDMASSLAKRNLGILLGGNYVPGIFTKGICNPCWQDAAQHIGVTPIPTAMGQAPGLGTAFGGWSLVISKNSKHPELAWKLLDFMQRKDNLLQELYVNGLVPPIPEYMNEPAYANVAPPYQGEFAKLLPMAKKVPVQASYPIWAYAFNQATESIALNPSTSVDAVLKKMETYIAAQVGPDKVTSRQ